MGSGKPDCPENMQGTAVAVKSDVPESTQGTEEDTDEASADAALCARNIQAALIFQALCAVFYGVAFGPVFDNYLFWLAGRRNSLVGVAESISGLTSLFIAVPVGILVDRRQGERARLLWHCSYVGALTAGLGITAVLTGSLGLIYGGLVCFGVFFEVTNSASEAIFADSISQGQRAKLFVRKGVLQTVCAACGPGISAMGFYIMGDEWKIHEMKAVIVTGLLILPVACFTLRMFKDPPAARQGDGESLEAPTLANTVNRRFCCLRSSHVPFIIATSDFITCVGAGMTVKFFNLFFINDMHFSAVDICWLQTAYPLVIALFMQATQTLAKPLGRAKASWLFFSCNVVCFWFLASIKSLPILLVVFFIRGGFANSTYPLDRSILMDFTPSSQRGRWNAISSLTSMTWSGSAFIGGLLSDTRDYRFTFLITAGIYALGCVIYFPLLKLVPRKEDQARDVSVGETSAEVPLSSAVSP